MADECIFCKIVNGEIPSEKVHEDDHVLAFKDIDPQAPVHIIIIPKKHHQSIMTVPAGEPIIAQMLETANRIALKIGIADSGFRLVTNVGEDGGQTVPHLHFHLLGGRAMQWPPG